MSRRSRVETACDRAAFGAVLLMLSGPALAFGGVYAWRHAGIEISAAVLGAAWSGRALWSGSVPRVRRGITRPWLLAGLAGLLLLPLVPVPPAALERVTPRAFELAARSLPGWPAEDPFAAVLRAASVEPAADGELAVHWPRSWRPVAVVPSETARALSLGTAYVLLATAVAAYPWRRGRAPIQRLVTMLIGLAVAETLYAFVQQTQASRRIGWFECQQGTSCLGTFINRNHFAGFVEMILPLLLGRVGFRLARGRAEAGGAQRRAGWLAAASRQRLARALAGGAVAVTLMVGLAVSSSRAALLVTLGSLAIMGPLRPRGRRAAGGPARPRLVAFGVLAALAALWLTFPQIGQRITLRDPARWALAREAVGMARDFPALGVGLGNFGAVFPAYRSRTIRLWGFPIAHAHNDYLEWLAEVGLPAALLSAVLLSALGARAVRALRSAAPDSSSAWLLWGACTGAFALLLHSSVDFNLHTPANALVFAFLLGCIARLTRPDAPAPERINAGALRRLPAVAGFALSLVWGLAVAERWRAEAAYASVYPDAGLRDLSAPRAAVAGDEAVAVLQRAAAAAATAPHIQAALGRQLLQRAADGSFAPPDSIALDAAIHAFVRSLAAAPLQPDTLLDLVTALEARAAANRSALRPVLDDLVGRAAALAPYDPEVQLRIADWHLRWWKALAVAERARAARRIEAALALAARAPALAQRRREIEARYELARAIGTGGREREGG